MSPSHGMIGGMGSHEFAKHGSLDGGLPPIVPVPAMTTRETHNKATGRAIAADTPTAIGGVSWALIRRTDTTTVWQLLLIGERTDTYVATASFDPPGMPPGVSYQGVYARQEALEWANRVDRLHTESLRAGRRAL